MKKIFTITFLILALFATTCSAGKSSPANDIKILCSAVIYGDEASLQRMGMTYEEYEKFFISEFSKSLAKSSGINFSEAQVTKINNALISVFRRTEISTETISQNSDTATVKVTVSQFEKFDDNTVMAYLPENISSLSYDEKVDAFVDAMAAALQNLRVVGSGEINVKCEYISNGEMWVPIEARQFGNLLSMKIFNL